MSKDIKIMIRVTEEEAAQIKQKAGETAIATYCRNQILGSNDTQPKVNIFQDKVLKELSFLNDYLEEQFEEIKKKMVAPQIPKVISLGHSKITMADPAMLPVKRLYPGYTLMSRGMYEDKEWICIKINNKEVRLVEGAPGYDEFNNLKPVYE